MTSAATSGGSPALSSAATSFHWRRLATCTAVCGIGFMLAGCASQDRVAQGSPSVDRFNQRYGVSSSPRVVEEGRPVPRGGGVYRVGRSYTVAGRRYTPYEKREGHTETGIASWYGRQFHGRLTANGEVYDMHTLSAAHRTMPMPSYARVTNLNNGHSLIVRVNDRGPFHGNRVIDLSQRASNMLDFRGRGLARVRVDYIGRAPLEGSDDRMLLATLRTDGSAAPRPSMSGSGTMIASASPAAQPAAVTQAASAPAPAPAPVQQAEAPAQEAPRGLFQLASATSAPAPQTQAAESAITMASAPMPQSRPAGINAAPQTTVVARATRDVPQVAAPSVTVVAAPTVQANPQPAAPVLAAASSRPVTMPTASAYAPAPAPAPAIAAMPASGPVRASLGFGSLY